MRPARQALYVALALLLLLILVMVAANVGGGARNPYSLSLLEQAPAPGAAAHALVSDETIFVSIASYRDHECPETINSLFTQARHPARVFVGLCVQNAAEDPACPGKLCEKCIGENIRVIHMEHDKARGPAFARYHCATLYRGEAYFMQIDSHMQFIQDWDALLIQELRKCAPLLRPGAHGAVLTHYPPADMTDELKNHAVTTHICRGTWENTGMVSFLSNQFENQDTPMHTYYLASGFMFGPGSMVTDVPYDPHMDFLFWGEEVLHAMRLWTSGYDIFSPGIAICSHSYEREYAKNVFSDSNDRNYNWAVPQEISQERVRYLLGWPTRKPLDQLPPSVTAEADKYGAGHKRSLEAYMKESQIDRKTQTLGNTCLYG